MLVLVLVLLAQGAAEEETRPGGGPDSIHVRAWEFFFSSAVQLDLFPAGVELVHATDRYLELITVEEDDSVRPYLDAPSRHLLRQGLTADGGSKDISDRFCAMNADGLCDWEGYAGFLVGILVAFIVLAVLSLCCIPGFLCGRYLCGCCGGKTPSRGMCGGGEELLQYPAAHMIGVKAAATLVCVAVVVCGSVAYAGNGKISEGLVGLLQHLTDAAAEIITRVDTIAFKLQSLNYTRSAGEQLQGSIKGARDIETALLDVKASVYEFDVQRSTATNVVLAIPMFCVLVGVILGWANIKEAGICCGMCLLLLLVVIFVSVGVHWMFATLLGDVCVEVDLQINTAQSNGNSSNPINQLLSCATGGGGPFEALRTTCTDGISAAKNATCTAANSGCSNPAVSCPVCDPDNVEGFVDAPMTVAGSPTTLRECSTDATCIIREEAKDAVESTEVVLAYIDILEEIIPLLSCSFVATLVQNLRDSLCELFLGGLVLVRNGQFAMSLILCFGVMVFILGGKRFTSPATKVAPQQQETWDDKEMDYYGDETKKV